MLVRLRSVLSSPLGRNIFYLYLAQGTNYLFPLLLLPYLSRTLKPEGFGVFAAGQAFGVALLFLLEYGFSLSGTREVAKHRGNPHGLAEVLIGVIGARFLLLFPALVLTLGAYLFVPMFHRHPLVVFSALFYAWAAALSPTWFYRGLERMREVALLEFFARLMAFVGVLVLVRGSEHPHLPLFLNGLASFIASLLGTIPLLVQFKPVSLSLSRARHFLLLGARLLPFQAVQAIYISVNPIVLSLFVPASEVGVFSGAERLVRPLWGLLEPFSRAFFPRLVYVVAQSEEDARGFFLKVLLTMGGSGFITTVLLEFMAPFLVNLFLGSSYGGSVTILRIMAPVLFFSALSHALGVQWGLALGMEKLLNGVSVLAAMLQLLLAFLLSAQHGAVGVAWGVVVVSALELSALALALLRCGKFPVGSRGGGRGKKS